DDAMKVLRNLAKFEDLLGVGGRLGELGAYVEAEEAYALLSRVYERLAMANENADDRAATKGDLQRAQVELGRALNVMQYFPGFVHTNNELIIPGTLQSLLARRFLQMARIHVKLAKLER